MKVQRIEQPCAAHFICVRDCNFRRATALVTPLRAVIVSSVGAYFPHNTAALQRIGVDRFFETFVFDARPRVQPTCCAYEIANGSEIDSEWPDANDPIAVQAQTAQEQHEVMVQKWTTILSAGRVKKGRSK